MLRDVPQPQARVLPQLAPEGQASGCQSPCQDGQQCRLARTILADYRHAAVQGHLRVNAAEHRRLGALVLEGGARQRQHDGDLLTQAARAGELLRRGEGQLVAIDIGEVHRHGVLRRRVAPARLIADLQHRLRLFLVAAEHLLFEGLEVPRVIVQLGVGGEMDDVRADLVEEAGVVRHDEGRTTNLPADARLVYEAHEPPHGLVVEVVRRLVQKQQVRLLGHRARQGEPHLPAAAHGANGFAQHLLVVEADVLEGPRHLSVRCRRVARVLQPRVLPRAGRGRDASQEGFGAQVHDSQLLRKPDDILARYPGHHRSLASAVRPDDAVPVAAEQLQRRVPEQRRRAAPVHEQ
mmetsp:Transcript_12937/g.36500  ORF Transcript_12937/g.36500 Transcript_12937/m.36500 type:complete len:350 (+) Transcript_12937:1-1050(+)